MAAYLSSLNLEISSQIRGQILDADTVPDLQTTFSGVLRISTATSVLVSDRSTMVATRGHGRGIARGGGHGGRADGGG